MEIPTDKGRYSYKGGKIIIGRIFAYQERTGMSYNDILDLPYITMILGGIDAPSIDTEKKEKKVVTPITAEEEAGALNNFLN